MIRNTITYIIAVLYVLFASVLKAVLYPFALIYLCCITYVIRAYVKTILRLVKLHKFMFKYWIHAYYSKGPSVMIIKDELQKLNFNSEVV